MKKRIIGIFFLISMLLTACSSEPTSETITSSKIDESYYEFNTQNLQEFIDFLKDLDEEKYEIIDIITSNNYSATDKFYSVAYKKISNTENIP